MPSDLASFRPKDKHKFPHGAPGPAPAAAPPKSEGSGADKEFLAAAKKSVLLSKKPPEAKAFINRACKLVKTTAGETLYTQDGPSENFYVVESGRYRAVRTTPDGMEMTLREFGPGETFGSHELLATKSSNVGPRREGIVTVEAGKVWTLSRKNFEQKVKMAPVPPPSLVERLKQISLFSCFNAEQLHLLCRAAHDVKVEKGEKVCIQGEESRHVYALCEGQLKRVVDGDDAGKLILHAPATFGEASLYPVDSERLYEADFTAWAGPATLMKFAVADIEALLGFALQDRALTTLNQTMLEHVEIYGEPIMNGLSDELKTFLSSAIVHEGARQPGEFVVKEGDTDEKLYVIRSGYATISTSDLGEAGQIGPGQYFGELALTGRKHKRRASISVSREGPLQLLSLSVRTLTTSKTKGLAEWIERLDRLAETAEEAKYSKETKEKAKKTTGFNKKLTDLSPKASPKVTPRAGDKDTSPRAAAIGGGEKLTKAEEEKRLKQHLLKRRMSYGEMLVEAQRSAKAAADKAARSVAIAKTRQNKPERDTIQPKKAKASKPKTNRKAKAPEAAPEAAPAPAGAEGGLTVDVEQANATPERSKSSKKRRGSILAMISGSFGSGGEKDEVEAGAPPPSSPSSPSAAIRSLTRRMSGVLVGAATAVREKTTSRGRRGSRRDSNRDSATESTTEEDEIRQQV